MPTLRFISRATNARTLVVAAALTLAIAALPAAAVGASNVHLGGTLATTVPTSYHTAVVGGVSVFYREAGPTTAPTIVLLHGFPSSSHMFRDLIPLLAGRYHLIAPDYPGFGYSAAPGPDQFSYTFEHLATIVDRLLTQLKIDRYSLYLQDYGGPIGFRLAAHHPKRIQALIVQNANAYVDGISPTLAALQPFWSHRDASTEKPVRALLTLQTTIFQYTHGAQHPDLISPDAWTFDQARLDRPGNDAIQLDLLHDYPSNVALYPAWHTYLRIYQPPTLIVWGRNDPFFTVAGARAFLRDLPRAELHLLDTGHFALEEDHNAIAAYISAFLTKNVVS